MTAPVRVLVNGRAGTRIRASDRGLYYGDGLFETILFAHGHAPLWGRHMTRLIEGCKRLALPMPDVTLLASEAATVAAGLERTVVRITWTRGPGPRGYALPPDPEPTRIVAAASAPAIAADWYDRGIRVRHCEVRLAEQPRLAGIKHLNRLEQVLARAEWEDATIAEGILCDRSDRVVSATAANLFAVIDGRLLTPALDRCGVAGVARAEVLALRPDGVIRDLGREELMHADEMFLTSSVRGIVPVAELGGRRWLAGPTARALQAHWRALFFPGATA